MDALTFRAQVHSIRYRGWTFTCDTDAEAGVAIVYVSALIPRAHHGGVFRLDWMTPWLRLSGLRRSQFNQAVRTMLADAEQHERDERLVIDGRRPFTPH